MRRSVIAPTVVLFTVAACADLLKLDEFGARPVPVDAGSGGAGSGGVASGGAGTGGAATGGATPAPNSPDAELTGSGGAPVLADAGDASLLTVHCANAAACPAVKNGCQIPACSNGACTIEFLTGLAECVGGIQCDGKGNCVNCLSNGNLDVGETDVDCGGTLCKACEDEKKCRADDDCLSKECHARSPGSSTKICFPGACNDHKKNGGEADIDCGGECQPCAQGLACGGDADCASGFCVDGVCCGVRCAGACRTCSAGTGACRLAAEGADPGERCPGATNACTASGRCSQCTNARTDGTGEAAETDIDCGGAACARCASGKRCRIRTDCASALCEAGKCAAPKCSNGVKDGAEADIDCGTVCASVCGVGATCETKLDCASGSCVQGRCLP